jgi:hypothetical protein
MKLQAERKRHLELTQMNSAFCPASETHDFVVVAKELRDHERARRHTALAVGGRPRWHVRHRPSLTALTKVCLASWSRGWTTSPTREPATRTKMQLLSQASATMSQWISVCAHVEVAQLPLLPPHGPTHRLPFVTWRAPYKRRPSGSSNLLFHSLSGDAGLCQTGLAAPISATFSTWTPGPRGC